MMDNYQQFIYKRTYARWLPDQHRREEWNESVGRYETFFASRVPKGLTDEYTTAIDNIRSLNVMPSMRALWTAGPALERTKVAQFNCTYMPISDPLAWSEMMLMLMSGCGVGFSVERQYINRLPEIPEDLEEVNSTFVFKDSKEGWAFGLLHIITNMYSGHIKKYDLSHLRPAGARLETFGGKSSGPEPLDQLLRFVIQTFKNARGRKLNSLEVHDVCCFIANCVVSGGVRRSATISLSNLTDERLQAAKRGEFWRTHPFRALSNNSVAYTEKPGSARFMREWVSLVESGSGERGIFNRESAEFVAMRSGRRSGGQEWGTNPCLTGDMRLLTSKGYERLYKLDGTEFDMINGDGRVVPGKVWRNGEKETVKITFGELYKQEPIYCTPDHKFMLSDFSTIRADELKPGDHLKKYVGTNPEVVSVEPANKTMVYDFSEPFTHWGIVEGIYTHNCSEIILRPYGLCNLSEVIVKPVDSLNDLKKKVEKATILGCLQSTLTDFKDLRPEWKENAEEERLLGVSLSGLADHRTLNHTSTTMKKWLTEMKDVAVSTAEVWSEALGINMPTAITCVKPSGTVSQLCNCSSGLHPAYSPYYIRRVRVSSTDNLAEYMIDAGVSHAPEVGQTEQNVNTWVFDFPRKSAKNSVLVKDVTALEQLEYWLAIQQNWCEHKPSATIYVDDEEWISVGAWIYSNWEWISGISFLPKTDTVYQLMPFEEISKNEYKTLLKDFPVLNFGDIKETTDETIGAKEYACVSGSCELV